MPIYELGEPLPGLGRAEEYALADRIAGGDLEARDVLIRRNLRLVPRVARPFLGLGVDREDLWQVGMLGLSHAADTFDRGFGRRFSTHAGCWIRYSIRVEVGCRSGPIRLPDDVAKLVARSRKLARRLGREPTPGEMGLAPGAARRLELARMAPVAHDLDGLAAADDDGGDEATALRVRDLLGRLGWREARVLMMRFGIDRPAMSLAEIARVLSLSKEAIRKIEGRALATLKMCPGVAGDGP